METMHFYKSQTGLFFRTTLFCIFWFPLNNLTSLKLCLREGVHTKLNWPWTNKIQKAVTFFKLVCSKAVVLLLLIHCLLLITLFVGDI